MIVAEASGEMEARDQLPLRPYAPSGSIVERTMRRMGYSRAQFSLTNTIRCRPRNNWLAGAPWEWSALNKCRPNLDAAIADRRPRAILALGDTAMRELTGEVGPARGVSHLAGYVLRGPNDIPVIPTFHPAYIRRGKASLQGIFARNLQRAVNVASGKDRDWTWGIDPDNKETYDQLKYSLHPSLDDARSFVNRVQGSSSLPLSYDIETFESASLDEDARDGFTDTRIRLIQFSTEAGMGIAFPWEGSFREIAAQILRSPNVKCGHNLWLFDNKVLDACGAREGLDLRPRGTIHDTLQMFHHWQPDLPAHLQFAAQFVQFPFPWKHLAATNLEFYGCVDVDATLRLYTFLDAQLRRDGIYDSPYDAQGQCVGGYVGQVAQVRPILAAMERRGLPVDDAERVKLDGEFDLAQQELDAELQSRVPPEVLGLEPRRGKKGNYDYGYLKTPKDLDGLVLRSFTIAAIDEGTGEPCRSSVERYCRIVPFNANSPDQLKRYMDARNHKRPKSKETDDEGNEKDTTAKKELVRLAHRHSDSFYLKVIEYRELSKMRGTYIEGFKPHADGRVHTTFTFDTGIGQLSSRNPNCFSSDTEVLTQRGWIAFLELEATDKVAQYSTDDHDQGQITFDTPLRYIQWKSVGQLHHIHTEEQIDLLVTGDHECLVRNRKTLAFRKVEAHCYPKDAQQLHAGIYVGGGLYYSEEQITLICALQADGHVMKGYVDVKGRRRGNGGHYTFGFQKERKIRRLRAALQDMNIPFSEKTTARVSTNFYVSRVDIPDWWQDKKFFGPWILELTRESLDYMADEIWFWDGSPAKQSQYSSSVQANTDWAQIITILSGRRAKIRAYVPPSGNTNWQLDASSHDYSLTVNHTNELMDYAGTVYCVTMPKGTVIVRRNGKAAITGQCQNFPKHGRLAKAVRRMIAAEPGHLLVEWDYKSCHVLTLGFLAEDANYIRCARIDMHSIVTGHKLGLWHAIHLLRDYSDDEIRAKCKWLKSNPEWKHIRDARMKHAILGIGNGLKARGLFEKHMEDFSSQKEAQGFLDVVEELFPKVFQWHTMVQQLAHNQQWLKTQYGHQRRFYEVFTWNYKKSAYGHGDQAEEAISYWLSNIAFGYIREHMKLLEAAGLNEKYGLCNNVHDSLVFHIREESLDEHVRDVYPVLIRPSQVLTHPTICPEGLWIDAECNAGRNWSEMEEVSVKPKEAHREVATVS